MSTIPEIRLQNDVEFCNPAPPTSKVWLKWAPVVLKGLLKGLGGEAFWPGNPIRGEGLRISSGMRFPQTMLFLLR